MRERDRIHRAASRGLIAATKMRPSAHMAMGSGERSRRNAARLVFLLLVVLPFLSEIVILLVSWVAELLGCSINQERACTIGPWTVSRIVDGALGATGMSIALPQATRDYFLLAVGAWLALSYVALVLGWARVASRLLLGFAAAFIFALLPFRGPMSAIRIFADEQSCKPESTGCKMFGDNVSNAYAALQMSELSSNGASLLPAGVVVTLFAIFVVISGIFSARRAETPARKLSNPQ